MKINSSAQFSQIERVILLGLGASSSQLLVRFGYTHPLPRSLRRPVEKVIISLEGSQL